MREHFPIARNKELVEKSTASEWNVSNEFADAPLPCKRETALTMVTGTNRNHERQSVTSTTESTTHRKNRDGQQRSGISQGIVQSPDELSLSVNPGSKVDSNDEIVYKDDNVNDSKVST